METKVWFVTCHTGYCGMDSHEVLVLPAHYSDDEVQEIAWEMAVENAAMFGIYPPEDLEDDEECDEPEYSGENIEGFAEPYNAEEHDGHSMCGDFSDEIEAQRSRL